MDFRPELFMDLPAPDGETKSSDSISDHIHAFLGRHLLKNCRKLLVVLRRGSHYNLSIVYDWFVLVFRSDYVRSFTLGRDKA